MFKVQFMICDSCFWCASILANGSAIDRCPCCKSDMMELMPLTTGEAFRFDHSPKSGIVLEFV